MDEYSINYIVKATDKASQPLKQLSAELQALQKNGSKTYETFRKGEKEIPSPTSGGGGLSSMLGAFKGLAGVTGGAMAIQSMVTSAMDFNTAMAKVATNIPEDMGKLKLLSEGIKQTAIETGRSTDELASAMYELTNDFKDASAPELMARLQSGMKLAKVSFTDTASSVDYLSRITSTYGKTSIEDMNRAAALTYSTMKKADVTLAEFASTMNTMAPDAKNLGVSMDEVFGIFATFADGKDQFNKLSGGLTLMMRTMASAGQGTSELDQVIQNLNATSGKQLMGKYGFAGALEEIRKKSGEMGFEFDNIIAGNRGLFTALKMDAKGMKELKDNIKGIPSDLDKINKATKAYDEVNKSGKAWKEFKETLSVTGIELGEITLPIVTTGLKQMSMSLQEFRKNINDIASGKSGFTQIADTLISVYTLGGSNLINKGVSKIGGGASKVWDAFIQNERGMRSGSGGEYIRDPKSGRYLTQEESIRTKSASAETIKLIITSDDEGNVNVNANKSGPKVKIAQGIQTVGG
jgi:TP901 family phage tail tape measure protein